ncbi:MAG TPA: hypothetical protein VK762_30000 [Polyangiaceae bacterium]|nr:hypothetical protein [Polyangiaceae bacterium]
MQRRIQLRIWAVVGGAVAVVLVVSTLRGSPAPTHPRSTGSSNASATPPAPAGPEDAPLRLTAFAPAPDRREPRPPPAPRPVVAPKLPHDTRTVDRMADDWAREPDNPEWTSNVRTFIGAMIDTFGDGQAAWPHSLDVRCRTSVCRIDTDGQDPETLRQLVESSREQQAHVVFRPHEGDADFGFEAYLGKDRAAEDESSEVQSP